MTSSLNEKDKKKIDNLEKLDEDLKNPLNSFMQGENQEQKKERKEKITKRDQLDILRRKFAQGKKKNDLNNAVTLQTNKILQKKIENSKKKINAYNENLNLSCTFHPLIDKNSKKLMNDPEKIKNVKKAQEEKRKKRRITSPETAPKYESDFPNSPYTRNKNKNNSTNSSKSLKSQGKTLYDRAMENIEKKKKIIESKSLEEIQSSQRSKNRKNTRNRILSIKNTHSTLKSNQKSLSLSQRTHLISSFISQSNTRMNQMEKKQMKSKLKEQYNDLQFYTFHPKIDPLEVEDDDVLIKKQVPFINDYVLQKRKNRAKAKASSSASSSKIYSPPNSILYVNENNIPRNVIPFSQKRQEKRKYRINYKDFIEASRNEYGIKSFYF